MNAFDVIIIGFGKGGKTLAAEFAKHGQKVAVVERSDKMYGGTCINIGCIPTKTLVHQAKIASGMKDAAFEEKRRFYRNAISVKESVTGALRSKNYHNLADNPNITVYTGTGSFTSSDTVLVRTATKEIVLKSQQIMSIQGRRRLFRPLTVLRVIHWFIPVLPLWSLLSFRVIWLLWVVVISDWSSLRCMLPLVLG